ncbi:MAG TPA: ribosome recycling factor [Ignavibacteria bacterium]|nr:ribosome recycling factor [Ignavibacteria bacterium]
MIKDIIKEANDRMGKAVDHVKSEMMKIRTGKASVSMLDSVKVDYYGTPTPISQVANISTPDFHTITVQPWDKTVIPVIEKAIMASDMGLNPANDGNLIRIPIPALNEERRKEMVKMVKKTAEEGKIAVRNIRRDDMEKLKKTEKEDHISEDERKHGETELQKLTDNHTKEIDRLTDAKEKEVMEV